jgi:hypothetical protein
MRQTTHDPGFKTARLPPYDSLRPETRPTSYSVTSSGVIRVPRMLSTIME